MTEGPRCGARTPRTGVPCQRAVAPGKRRCRGHGGVRGIGAPKGNRNRYVHGFYSATERAERRAARELLRQGWALVREWE